MKKNVKTLLIFLAVPLAVGILGALLGGGMADYKTLHQPPLSPPGWIFPIVWTVLYLLMGYASYRIYTAPDSARTGRQALTAYAVQLLLNLLWPLLFFGLHWYLAAFVLLLALWASIYLTMHYFSRIDETASNLLIPYLLWVTFAGYLNLGVALLN